MIVAVSDRLSRDGFEDQDDHQRGVVGTLTSPTARVSVKSAARWHGQESGHSYTIRANPRFGGCRVEIEAVEDGITWHTVPTRVTLSVNPP